MVVIPCDPAGRNVCAWLRRYAGQHSKLIVVGMPGSMRPGDLERVLRAQMPDVEKKLQVIDQDEGDGKTVSDAIEAAQAQGIYDAGEVLTVYCDSRAAASFAMEIRAGQLDLDPTTITTKVVPIPKDDGLEDALASGDPNRLRAVLDPHIFTDPADLEDVRRILVGESVVREFITDIAPTRELGIQVLHDLLSQKLSSAGMDIHDMEYLGSGRNGSAYRTPDGLVLKVTTDPNEAMSARRLVGKPCEYIHLIHGVTSLSERVWLLAQEGDLEKLPEAYHEEFDTLVAIAEAAGAGEALRRGDIRSVITAIDESDVELGQMFCEGADRFGLGGMCDEVARLGLSADFHSGNIMLRSGVPVLTDLGTPGDPASVKESADLADNSWVNAAHEELEVILDAIESGQDWELLWSRLRSIVDSGLKVTTSTGNARFPIPSRDKFSDYEDLSDWEKYKADRARLHRRLDDAIRNGLVDTAMNYEQSGSFSWGIPPGGDTFKQELLKLRPRDSAPVAGDVSQESRSGGPVINEFGIQAGPAPGASVNMRGSGSSAWSGGRLVLAKPENHVPEDENAKYERDSALDWGFYGAQK